MAEETVDAGSVPRDAQESGACGATSQPCCNGSDCNPGLACSAGTCIAIPPDAGSADAGGNRPPFFLTSGTNITTMTPADTLIISAILTDPDGVMDLVGGTLVDPGGATYGTFVSPTTPGSYTLTLTWQQINSVRAIDVPAGGAPRLFHAVFFDSVGNTAERDITVTIICSYPNDTSCAGHCVDLMTDDSNCGACGRAVPSPVEECSGGVPVVRWSDCMNPVVDQASTCAVYCAKSGYTCADRCGDGQSQSRLDLGQGSCYSSGTPQTNACGTQLFNDWYRCCCAP